MASQGFVVNFLFHYVIKCRFDYPSFRSSAFDQLSGHAILLTQFNKVYQQFDNFRLRTFTATADNRILKTK